MTPHPEPRPADLTHYTAVLRSQWRPIVAGIAAGLLASTGVLAFSGSSYTATTDLNINVISTDPFDAQRSASGLLDGVTEAQIASSYAVAMRAAESLDDGVTPDQLRDGADASTVADATIIRISFTGTTPDEARTGADALADAYLSYRAAQAGERLGGVIDRIEERLGGLREDLTDANARAASSEPGTTEANQAASDRDLVTIEIDSLLEEKNALDLIDTSGGSVLSTASENELASGPRPLPVLLTGLLAGLVLGLIAAFVVDAMSRKLMTVTDVERATGAIMLTRITSRHGSIPARGTTLEELRTARERIYTRLQPTGNVIALFDLAGTAQAGDIPANLAMVFVQDGQPTHLLLPGITADIRDALIDQQRLVVVDGSPGGVSYSTEDGLFSLHVPDAADADIDPNGLITDFVHQTVATIDPDSLVIIALPRNAPHSSALTAGRLADAMGLIVALGRTRVSEAAAFLDESALLDTEFMGTIAVPDARRVVIQPRTEAVDG